MMQWLPLSCGWCVRGEIKLEWFDCFDRQTCRQDRYANAGTYAMRESAVLGLSGPPCGELLSSYGTSSVSTIHYQDLSLTCTTQGRTASFELD